MDKPKYVLKGQFGGLTFRVFDAQEKIAISVSKGVFTFAEFGTVEQAREFAQFLTMVADWVEGEVKS